MQGIWSQFGGGAHRSPSSVSPLEINWNCSDLNRKLARKERGCIGRAWPPNPSWKKKKLKSLKSHWFQWKANPRHTYLGVSPIGARGPYSRVNMHRLSGSWNQGDLARRRWPLDGSRAHCDPPPQTHTPRLPRAPPPSFLWFFFSSSPPGRSFSSLVLSIHRVP